jgi:hypothetical protein
MEKLELKIIVLEIVSRRNRRTRRQPVTVVDLEVDSSQEG